jgi:histidyl-tRNA synthetase
MQLVRWVGSENVPTVRRAEVATVYREGAGRLPPREYAQVDFDIVGPAESVEGRALADAELLKVSLLVTSTHTLTHTQLQSAGTARYSKHTPRPRPTWAQSVPRQP